MNDQITILIADDHPIFRRGLRMVIESDPALKVIGEADNGNSALETIGRDAPDVAVLDVDMPLADGLAVAKTIRDKNLATHAIFLTMYDDEAIFNAALDAGVKGFVIKDSAASDIVNCIKAVARGRRFFSAQLSQYLYNRATPEKSPREMLTDAEARILRLIAGGKTSRDIADELFISVRTVEHHRSHICTKLDLTGKNALLTYALTNKNEILG